MGKHGKKRETAKKKKRKEKETSKKKKEKKKREKMEQEKDDKMKDLGGKKSPHPFLVDSCVGLVGPQFGVHA